MNNIYLNRKLNRLEEYDYSQAGYYFVTLCTKDKKEWLGSVVHDKTVLSEYGLIANDFWMKIPEYYNAVKLDEFIIMPNHLHGIIIIVGTEHRSVQKELFISDDGFVGTEHRSVQNELLKNGSNINGTEHCSVPTDNQHTNYGLLSKIIKSFKEKVVKTIKHKFNNTDFQWQRSFYDHIIRNEKSLEKIREYIAYNPLKWNLDEYYQKNV